MSASSWRAAVRISSTYSAWLAFSGPNASLAEGAYTAAVAAAIARERGIAMPITDAVSAIIDGRMTVTEALKTLMERPLTTEGR